MGRKFIVDESKLTELLSDHIQMTMLQRDGVNSWQWYGENYYNTIQDYYPEAVTKSDINEQSINFEKCAMAIINSGKYKEIN